VANARSADRKTLKEIVTSFRVFSAIALLALATGRVNTQSKENSLVAAGFKGVVIERWRIVHEGARNFANQEVATMLRDQREDYARSFITLSQAWGSIRGDAAKKSNCVLSGHSR